MKPINKVHRRLFSAVEFKSLAGDFFVFLHVAEDMHPYLNVEL